MSLAPMVAAAAPDGADTPCDAPQRTPGRPEMIELTVKTRDGAIHAVSGKPGVTLMEAIRKAEIYELVAVCGGSCSCATCHVFVETGPAHLQSPASEDEDDLLDSSDDRAPNSRLSCQMVLADGFDGMVVQIAPEA